MSHTRQLAAIMFTDIQGYTALMQDNEQKARQVRTKHRRIFNSTTEKHHGRILQYYGDGTLSIFDSAIDAVQCAIEMQLAFLEDPPIPVRIGIHSGEISFSEEEIIGDSVNVASRVESMAVPGSILISEKVYDDIKNQASIKTLRLKAFRLKNVQSPLELFAIANAGLVVPRAGELQGKTAEAQAEETADPSQLRPGGLPFLATKLFIPPPRPRSVRRPRLMERIDAGMHGKMTLVSAPAGFGKTTLVSEWIAAAGRPVAWLSLDPGDSNPVRFLTYLTVALRTVAEDVGEGVLSMLQSPQAPPAETIITTLLNELSARPRELVLVLDDYHVVDAQTIDQALALLLDYLPPGMHLLMTTREDPNLPLARLRVRNQLTELRAGDLRFTPAEAAGFLNEVMGLQLTTDHIAALENRTEGWIAGLQMAALSLQGRADADAFIREFTGSHRFILDYLAGEVLQQQPEPTRRFLLDTAILDRLCGPLCDAVTRRDDSQMTLETMERGNLFIVPLDDQRRWYRYHHLFADVLRARAIQEKSEGVHLLHQRASQWYDDHGFAAESIHHALAARDFHRAAGLIERAWPEMDNNYQSATWLQWAEALPEELVGQRPVLIGGIAWAMLNAGALEAGEARLREVEEWLRNEEPAEMIVVDEEQFRFLPASMAIARAYLSQASGEVPAAISFARQALDLLPEDNHILYGQAAALLGLSYWVSGELESAYRALSDTMNHFLEAGNLTFAISVTYGLADIRIAQGRLRAATGIYENTLRMVNEQGTAGLRGAAELYMGLGDLARERGELEKAGQYLQKSEELGLRAGLPNWHHRQRLAMARLAEAQGKPEQALQLFDEAKRLYFRSPMPDDRPIDAQKARVLALHNRLAEAQTWAEEQKLSTEDDLSYLKEFEHITLARVLIRRYQQDPGTGTIEAATALLVQLRKAAEAGGRTGRVIEILLQQALASQALHDQDRAIEQLEEALTLASPEGYFRIFVDEGAPMARLLHEAAARGIMTEYVRRLLAGFPAPPKQENLKTPAGTSPPQPLIEPLSERELEILRLIAQGLSNREISLRLFISLSTVKGHNQNIFSKLDVQRRTEAVARARELGML